MTLQVVEVVGCTINSLIVNIATDIANNNDFVIIIDDEHADLLYSAKLCRMSIKNLPRQLHSLLEYSRNPTETRLHKMIQDGVSILVGCCCKMY